MNNNPVAAQCQSLRKLVANSLCQIGRKDLLADLPQFQNAGKAVLTTDIKYFVPRLVQLMNDLVTQWIAMDCNVAVYGMGKNAEFLLRYTRLRNCRIVTIIHDDPAESEMWGIPVLPRPKLTEIRPDKILIASATNQQLMFQKLKSMKFGKKTMVQLYNELALDKMLDFENRASEFPEDILRALVESDRIMDESWFHPEMQKHLANL